jgi:hypothetical protein
MLEVRQGRQQVIQRENERRGDIGGETEGNRQRGRD